ncbi:MAG TPA: Uma2 family endonuclease [Longimicrobium sp.]
MATQIRTSTADELLRMPSDMRCELIEGEIFEMTPAGRPHGRIASRFHGRLEPYVRERELGEAYVAEFGYRVETNPDTVLVPDVSFVTAAREHEFEEDEGYFPGAPDLAVEVISPTDRYSEVALKVQKYLKAGARMVVVIDPPKRTLIVHQSRSEVLILKEGDVFDAGDLIPGFQVRVRDLFTRLKKPTSTDPA